MRKKFSFVLLSSIILSAACGVRGPSPLPANVTNGQATQSTAANSQASTLDVSVPTDESSRSAGIDLLPDGAGTATPDLPPTVGPQIALSLVPSEWYLLNSTDLSGDFSATVLGWGVPDADGITQPAPGSGFVRVDAVLYNQGNSYRQIWSEQATLQDGAANTYKANNLYFLYEKNDQGELQIAPGEHIRHQFYFTVPENPTPLVFQFNPCSGNNGQCDHVLTIPLAKTSPGNAMPPAINSPDPGIHALGEVVTQGMYAFGATRWELIPSSEYTPPANSPQGTNLVKIKMLVTNLGKKSDAMDATGNLWVSLKDRSGRYFPPDLSVFTEGDAAPGERLQRHYYFQVPPGATGLELVVDAIDPVKGWPALTRTFINLGEGPTMVEPSSVQLPGSLAPNAIPVGQAGLAGDIQITVEKVAYPNTSFCSVKPGQQAVLVTVQELNTSGSPVQGYPLRALLKDSQGDFYASCNLTDNSPTLGELPAGATRTIQYSFVAANDPGDFWLVQSQLEPAARKIFFLLK